MITMGLDFLFLSLFFQVFCDSSSVLDGLLA